MMERRKKRSEGREEALQFLVEAVADRSDVRAVAVVDDAGRIVAGTGSTGDLSGLQKVAAPVARGQYCAELEAATEGTDVLTRGFVASGETLYLAALGTRVRRMSEAVVGVNRILRTTGNG